MRAVYTGHEALTFPGYLDLDTGRTLTAEPGGAYDIAPASGQAAAEIPAGWFTPVYGGTWVPAAAAESAAEEGAGDDGPAADGEAPGTEEEPAPEPAPEEGTGEEGQSF